MFNLGNFISLLIFFIGLAAFIYGISKSMIMMYDEIKDLKEKIEKANADNLELSAASMRVEEGMLEVVKSLRDYMKCKSANDDIQEGKE